MLDVWLRGGVLLFFEKVVVLRMGSGYVCMELRTHLHWWLLISTSCDVNWLLVFLHTTVRLL